MPVYGSTIRKGKRTFLGTAKPFNKQRVVYRAAQPSNVREIHPEPALFIKR